jgi:hypothetical protein
VQCLRGTLPRDTTTVDEAGHERTYKRGTEVVLRKRGETYQLLATVPDELPPQIPDSQQLAARKFEHEHLPEGFVPF